MSVQPSNFWNKRYDTDDYIFGTEPSQFLKTCAPHFQTKKTALSLADGEGRNSVWLASKGIDVLAMDISKVGLEKAKRLAKQEGTTIRTTIGNLCTWDWAAQTYDIILAMNFHLTESQRSSVFRGCEQALAPGGLLVFEGIHKSTNDHHDPATVYDEATLNSLCPNLNILFQSLEQRDAQNGAKSFLNALMQKPE